MAKTEIYIRKNKNEIRSLEEQKKELECFNVELTSISTLSPAEKLQNKIDNKEVEKVIFKF